MSGEAIRLTDGRTFTAAELLELINASSQVVAQVTPAARAKARQFGGGNHYVASTRLQRLAAALKVAW